MPNAQQKHLAAPHLDHIEPADLNLLTPPTRAAFGRRLYQYNDREGQRWILKTQLQNGHADVATSFQYELAFYEQFNQQHHFVLPYSVMQQEPNALFGESVLLLPQADEFLHLPAAQLSYDACLHRIWQMVNALDEMHQSGWLHADLKAAHFVEYGKHVCLVDFEQALPCSANQEPLPTKQQFVTATPRYMAPELFHGEEKTQQSDLYAFGIILLEWLTGQRLHAKSYQDWALLHCQQLNIALKEPQKIFLGLVEGLLSKHKNARFANLTQVKQFLMTEIE